VSKIPGEKAYKNEEYQFFSRFILMIVRNSAEELRLIGKASN